MDDKQEIKVDVNKITIPISEFQKLSLTDKDILVLKASVLFRKDDIAIIEEGFSGKFGCKVILLDARYSIHGVLEQK